MCGALLLGWRFEADLVVCVMVKGYFYHQLRLLVGFGGVPFPHPELHVGNVDSLGLYLGVEDSVLAVPAVVALLARTQSWVGL